MLVMFASLIIESDVVASDVPIVCEFPDVLLEDICHLPPEREVEFTIDLVMVLDLCRWIQIECLHWSWNS